MEKFTSILCLFVYIKIGWVLVFGFCIFRTFQNFFVFQNFCAFSILELSRLLCCVGVNPYLQAGVYVLQYCTVFYLVHKVPGGNSGPEWVNPEWLRFGRDGGVKQDTTARSIKQLPAGRTVLPELPGTRSFPGKQPNCLKKLRRFITLPLIIQGV